MRAPVAGAVVGTTVMLALACTAGQAAVRTSKQPTLGTKSLFGSKGRGWGTVKPKVLLYPETDCKGYIRAMKWTSWGGRSATGTGTTCAHTQAPGTETIRFEATGLKICTGTHTLAYSRFLVQEPDGKGGYRPQFNWYGRTNFCGPSPTKSPGAPFAGTWRQHEGVVVIHKSGKGHMDYPDLRRCPSCSFATAPAGTMDFVLTSTKSGVGTGHVTATSDSKVYFTGESVRAKLARASPGQFLILSFNGIERLPYCDATASGQCGA